MRILYLCLQEHNSFSYYLTKALLKFLSNSNCDYVGLNQNDSFDLNELGNKFDVIFLQNSYSLFYYKDILSKFRNVPVLFFTYASNINGLMPPVFPLIKIFTNVRDYCRVVNCSSQLVSYTPFPVWETSLPSKRSGNKRKTVVYFPESNGSKNVESKVIRSINNFHDVHLILISDQHIHLKEYYGVKKIYSYDESLQYVKKADVVIASGYHIIQALALGKTSVVLGDHGLGGTVCLQNYDNLKTNYFKGRAGGTVDELVPGDLFFNEIERALYRNDQTEQLKIRELILKEFSFSHFENSLHDSLADIMKIRTDFLSLRFFLNKDSTYFFKDKTNYITINNIDFYQISYEMKNLLNQLDGNRSLKDLLAPDADTKTIILNLKTLWKNSLIYFS